MASARSTRARKRHVQQELFRRGGKRRGAGRKPNGARARERHEARPEFRSYHALHVVMRIAPGVGSLRRRRMYKAMRDATITAALRERFRIVHISLQRTHVHMIVEAEDKAALARGMQGFQISAARHINTPLGDGVRRRSGKVFADRYHVEVITSPTRARYTLSYVRFNRPIPAGFGRPGVSTRPSAGSTPRNSMPKISVATGGMTPPEFVAVGELRRDVEGKSRGSGRCCKSEAAE
jgi:REP element-mobilizing transposase RayT